MMSCSGCKADAQVEFGPGSANWSAVNEFARWMAAEARQDASGVKLVNVTVARSCDLAPPLETL